MGAREFFVLLAMCIIWGFHFVVIKVAVSEIPPLFYAAIRMSLVAVLLAPFLRWRSAQMSRVLLAGACFGGLNYAFLFTGIANATAASAALAIELYVPLATILSVIFLNEKVRAARITGIALAFMGVAVIAFAKGEVDVSFGIGLIVMAALFESIGAVTVKKIDGFQPLQLLAWFAVVGTPILWIASLGLEQAQWKSVEQGDFGIIIGAVLYSAIGGSIIGHTSYYWLLQRLPLSIVAPSGLLTTLLAVVFAVVFLGDVITLQLMVGGLLTLTGVAIVLFRTARRETSSGQTNDMAP